MYTETTQTQGSNVVIVTSTTIPIILVVIITVIGLSIATNYFIKSR